MFQRHPSSSPDEVPNSAKLKVVDSTKVFNRLAQMPPPTKMSAEDDEDEQEYDDDSDENGSDDDEDEF